jgi:hypothetical protein
MIIAKPTTHEAEDVPAEKVDVEIIHYAHVPMRVQKWMSCDKCETGFVDKPLVHFYVNHDYNRPVCEDCALQHGFNIFCDYGSWEIGHDTARCQLNADGNLETWLLDDNGQT